MGVWFLAALLIAACVPAASAEEICVEKIDLYNMAVDEAQAGNYTSAMAYADAALAIDNTFTLVWVTKAGISSAQGNYTAALAAAEKATSLNPNQTQAWVVTADALLNLGEYERAVEAAETAIALDPDMIESYIIQGTAYGQMGEYDKEIAVSERALEINPSDVRAQGNLHFAEANVGGGTESPAEETPFPIAGAILGAGALLLISRRW
ncbi:Beta-barrel assembly-enhancing protease [Methanogenium sp. MK-MG]|nr:Beta-barrel assembly-enhancing protease [Methanogenium sp. MK-MG]